VVKLGRALHECGATSQRVERHLMDVSYLTISSQLDCEFQKDSA
jgi:uncharacterized membrane protein YjjP (DUF1212 family)